MSLKKPLQLKRGKLARLQALGLAYGEPALATDDPTKPKLLVGDVDGNPREVSGGVDLSGKADLVDGLVPANQLPEGIPNGIATLDAEGRLPLPQMTAHTHDWSQVVEAHPAPNMVLGFLNGTSWISENAGSGDVAQYGRSLRIESTGGNNVLKGVWIPAPGTPYQVIARLGSESWATYNEIALGLRSPTGQIRAYGICGWDDGLDMLEFNTYASYKASWGGRPIGPQTRLDAVVLLDVAADNTVDLYVWGINRWLRVEGETPWFGAASGIGLWWKAHSNFALQARVDYFVIRAFGSRALPPGV